MIQFGEFALEQLGLEPRIQAYVYQHDGAALLAVDADSSTHQGSLSLTIVMQDGFMELDKLDSDQLVLAVPGILDAWSILGVLFQSTQHETGGAHAPSHQSDSATRRIPLEVGGKATPLSGALVIPDLRRKEVLAWLDDRARDYGLSHREIALARDAASLIRERDAKAEAGLEAGSA